MCGCMELQFGKRGGLDLGNVPYVGLAWSNEFVRMLEGGFRLELPSRMPPKIAQLVKACWELESGNRPTFSFLQVSLDEQMHSCK